RGSVSSSVYLYYFQESGGVKFGVMILVNSLLTQAMRVSVDYWLSLWSSNYYQKSTEFYMLVFGLLGAAQTILTTSWAIQFALMGYRAALTLHNKAFANV